ncbi:hypothetical protein SORBI_3005G016100 [Sorghum bicolor]|uniref:KIB1-4 beta-propeller domain-containing protein n=1 Tax=Sorghum bicolor TaxID=4558 RepID=A0A1Z5RHA6_SORBI|nr:hypothetical protein SORBI_3005G016100 [Sorghum bicolor]
MFVQISWTACFMKSLFSSTHSRTSLLLVAPATLGVQQSLPSPLLPQNTPNEMDYLGCSHGYLIFTYEEHCLLVDAYTGAKVGTTSWSEHPLDLDRERVYQVVSFKGHILVVDTLMGLHTIQLTPQFSMNEVAITWRTLQTFPFTTWFVVCGDMLLMVNLTFASVPSLGSSLSFGGSDVDMRFFKVFRLDFSVKPAKWVQMEKLENYALFLSLDRRNPAFSCVNPERWGGKSNCVYVAKLFNDADPEETWTALEVGQSVPHHHIVDLMMYSRHSHRTTVRLVAFGFSPVWFMAPASDRVSLAGYWLVLHRQWRLLFL